MSNHASHNAPPEPKPELKAESAKFDDSSQNLPENKLQSEASRELSSPQNMLSKIHKEREIIYQKNNRQFEFIVQKDNREEIKNNKTPTINQAKTRDPADNQPLKKFSEYAKYPDGTNAPRYFVQDAQGNLLERKYTPEQTFK